jgi:hypothetical protein
MKILLKLSKDSIVNIKTLYSGSSEPISLSLTIHTEQYYLPNTTAWDIHILLLERNYHLYIHIPKPWINKRKGQLPFENKESPPPKPNYFPGSQSPSTHHTPSSSHVSTSPQSHCFPQPQNQQPQPESCYLLVILYLIPRSRPLPASIIARDVRYL